MSLKQCPLCGKTIEESGERFCVDCRQLPEKYGMFSAPDRSSSASGDELSLDTQIMEDPLAGEPQASKLEVAAVSPRKKRTSNILLILLAVLLFLGACVGVYFYIRYQQRQTMEELDCWNQTLRVNTNKAYLAYMQRYPEGEYVPEAQKNILKFNENVKKCWEDIKQNGTESEILTFLTVYKDTPYHREAGNLLDSLAWAHTEALNTQEAYKKYLDRVSQAELAGQYKALAEEKFAYFSKMEFVGGDEWASVEAVVSRYFRDLSSESYSDLSTLFSENVKTFYGMKDVTAQEVIHSIQSQMNKDDIVSMAIAPETENMKAQKDIKGFYFVSVEVQKVIKYKKSEEKSVLTQVNLVMDGNLKIYELTESALNVH